ncbi:hypothetical protein J6590_030633 [Homalodisca vitripennis]|nr:hypothetical protein J6590_030633 [Homalodisca vitripennis]
MSRKKNFYVHPHKNSAELMKAALSVYTVTWRRLDIDLLSVSQVRVWGSQHCGWIAVKGLDNEFGNELSGVGRIVVVDMVLGATQGWSGVNVGAVSSPSDLDKVN